ncbi:hypothetical protein NDN08_004927 [Rhodosorus marinus]|uniref:Protein Abitram n=1 Tax=Rhodosorus marinus TaxID=101924 RepID=A0AAV8UIC7_9RHOD|nr:hypothetical protein NDN08_004927 [Rhodosorus marinus]
MAVEDEYVISDDGSRVKLLDNDIEDKEEDGTRVWSVLERYYTRWYWVSENGDEDLCVMRHSNGICVVTLSEEHAVVAGDEDVTKVELREGFQEPKGKRKRQGTFVQEESTLCTVHTKSKSYKIRARIRGVLLELNENLTTNPALIKTENFDQGFIAIVLPKSQAQHDCVRSLTRRDDYMLHRQGRAEVDVPQHPEKEAAPGFG